MITIDFDIGEDDIPRFLETMTSRRRIRKRDGARRWSLLRGVLSDPISGQKSIMCLPELNTSVTINAGFQHFWDIEQFASRN